MASPQLDAFVANLRAAGGFDGDLMAMRRMLDRAPAYQQPPDVTFDTVTAGGVPAEWVTPEGFDAGRAIVYCHGGGYATGAAATFRSLTSHLARATRVRVLAVDYRLAPEHPYPAALDDALAAYRSLLADHSPEDIAFVGDSSGGGLVLGALVALRDAGDPLPAAAVCLCPWTDLTLSGGSLETNAASDVMVRAATLRLMSDAYLGSVEATTPTASPLFADLAGLPPLLIQVGAGEILLDDAKRLAERAAASGVDVTLDVADDGFHVWHSFADMLPEAREAIAQVAAYLDTRLGGPR